MLSEQIEAQLNRIKHKVALLRKLDTDYSLFGAFKHRYKLNPVLSVQEIQLFENAHKVKLPEEYVAFLTKVGNGGAGPFYGLEPFENALFDDLDYKRTDSLLNPAKPFLHTTYWNSEFKPTGDMSENEEAYSQQLAQFEERYFDKELVNGMIAICNYGCGVRINLVVNGREYGNIWTDDRANDGGIYPSGETGSSNSERLTFFNWYELWADNCLKQYPQNELPAIHTELHAKKPWWKFW